MIKWLLCICAVCMSVSVQAGKLLVVGGALQSSTADVYRAFIDAVPAQQRFVIVPVASGKPHTYAHMMAEDLQQYGVAPARISVLPLALADDPATPDVDESLWAGNAREAAVWQSLGQVGGIWFVGGDQTRITSALKPGGEDTPMALWLRERLAAGAIIGGTSAGAAMMSANMIAGGDSISALLSPPADEYAGMDSQENGPLHIQTGMGFWPGVLVDQHFDRKARLGRLTVALCDQAQVWGVGVDEDTALLVDLTSGQWQALGNGNVTLLDSRGQQCARNEKGYRIDSIRLWTLARGDTFDVARVRLLPNPARAATVGHEAFSHEVHAAGGMALGNGRLDQLLGFDLLDNSRNNQVSRFSFVQAPDGMYLFEYRFRQTDQSQGYWAYLDGTKDSYSAASVDFQMQTRRLEVKP